MAVLAILQVVLFPLYLLAQLARSRGAKESSSFREGHAKLSFRVLKKVIELSEQGENTAAAEVAVSEYLHQIASQMRGGEIALDEYIFTKEWEGDS